MGNSLRFLIRPANSMTPIAAFDAITEQASTLQTQIRGDVLLHGDAEYDHARAIWNGMIDRLPALIVRCMTDEDVIACINFARANGLTVTVRGGGHNVSGSALSNGGLVIDLSRMNAVEVNPATRRAVAQGGATIGDVDRATQSHGLAAPLGVVSATGIAGLTLGGGMGWLRRKHGLACDALRAATVVTADGHLVHASANENADLFWALRGGGGNFGVVTRFEYDLYPVGPEVFLLGVFYAAADAQAVVQQVRRFMETAPEAFAPLAVLAHVPPFDVIPVEQHGKPCILLVGPYIGDVTEGEGALAPLRSLATPLADISGAMSYLDVQQFFDADYPNGGRYYWKSIYLHDFEPDAVDKLIALNEAAPATHSTLDLWFGGGAMARVAPDATAFGDRSASAGLGIEANWHHAEDDAVNIAWARSCFNAMQPFSDGRMYLNFPGLDGEARVEATYGANYARLTELKRRYDPDGLFRTHQNITAA